MILISAIDTVAKTPIEWAFIRLDHARERKATQLQSLCERTHELARTLADDRVMQDFFGVSCTHFAMQQENRAPAEFTQKMRGFEQAISDHYIRNYLPFHDVMLIAADGNVVYTIRREKDLNQNLFTGPLQKTTLARALQNRPTTETFVDFHYYGISDEPAAFFIEPCYDGDRLQGWFVLQWSINKLNALFGGTESLGETGESFLVNHDGYMLTESNFTGDSTILKQQLDENNIQPKFNQGHGHRIVTDYRGFTALSSFRVFDFLGCAWLVVAKVDEAEVITEHYRDHRTYFAAQLIDHIRNQCSPTDQLKVRPTPASLLRVDMDEYKRAVHGEQLQTVGVSTCTAVIASYAGKFGYLAHISPHDRMYGGEGTNILGHVLNKIKVFDIYKYERRYVRFLIVARHFNSMANIVNKLVNEGFLLSQIRVLYQPNAQCANVNYDYAQDTISVEWVLNEDPPRLCTHNGQDACNLGAVMKQYMERDKTL